jgi:transposase
MAFRYKRCRFSLKENAMPWHSNVPRPSWRRCRAWRGRAGQCYLLYYDESGFSPNPPLQCGVTPIGHSRCAETRLHRQRVNVLNALGHDNNLLWTIKEQRTVRDDVIAFFDAIADQSHLEPRIVVLDNANIHRGEAMEKKLRQWQRRGLYLYDLPPYSSELNLIEIVWKQAKYFWRKFVRLTCGALVDEVNSIMMSYGKKFTINFK